MAIAYPQSFSIDSVISWISTIHKNFGPHRKHLQGSSYTLKSNTFSILGRSHLSKLARKNHVLALDNLFIQGSASCTVAHHLKTVASSSESASRAKVNFFASKTLVLSLLWKPIFHFCERLARLVAWFFPRYTGIPSRFAKHFQPCSPIAY